MRAVDFIRRIYLIVAVLILITTATLKFASDFDDPRLDGYDQVFRIVPTLNLMITVAIVELVAAFTIIQFYLTNNRRSAVLVVTWIFSVFALYRIAFHFSPLRAGVCKCLGVGSLVANMEPIADLISVGLLLTMLPIGYSLLFIENHRKVQNIKTAEQYE
jgi:hypothetical protein